jgi:hypothetical protein
MARPAGPYCCPPEEALSAIGLIALAWFMITPRPDRAKLVKSMRWAAEVFRSSLDEWPLHLARPLVQAQAAFAVNIVASVWLSRLVAQLEIVGRDPRRRSAAYSRQLTWAAWLREADCGRKRQA